MRAIALLAMKDLRLLTRDRTGFFFVFIWPLIFAIFFGIVNQGFMGSDDIEPMPIVLVDADGTPESQEFAASLGDSDALKIRTAATRDEASGLVRSGQYSAAIIIEPGFGEAAQRIFWGEAMQLSLLVDPARRMEGALLRGVLHARAFEQLAGLFTQRERMLDTLETARQELAAADKSGGDAATLSILDAFLAATQMFFTQYPVEALDAAPTTGPAGEEADAGPFGGWQPIEVSVEEVVAPTDDLGYPRAASAYAFVFPQAIVWGVMACAATFALTLVLERTRGTLPRLTTAPIARWQILLGKAAACFVATLSVSVALLILARFAFGVRPYSVPMVALGVLCLSFAIVGVMLLFSVLGRSEAAVGGISWAIIVLMAMFGGGMLPLFVMKGWMITLSQFSIFRWAILALEGGIWRGLTLAEMALPCGILLLIGATGLIVGSSVFRWQSTR